MVKEWPRILIGDVFDFKNGLSKGKEFFGQGTPFISYSEVYKNNSLKAADIKGRVSLTKEEISNLAVQKNDVFFTRTSETPEEVGYSAVLLEDVPDCVFNGFVLRARPRNTWLFPDYCKYCFSTKPVREEISKRCKYTTRAGITGKALSEIEIPLPPINEQKAIAEVLDVMETHIQNLYGLIEKKKSIRDGALEDLMSRRTRMGEYANQEWITIPFYNYFTIIKNNTYARESLSDYGAIGNIHYGDILVKYGSILSDRDVIPRLKEGIDYSEKWILQENDVLIADTAEDETVGKATQIGAISYLLVGGLHTIACRPNMPTAPGFLGYYINSKAFHDQILPHITGIKVSSISKKAIKTTKLKIPSSIEEQAAITEALVSMDEEIKSLENERDKYIQICEGAMDDLLTGHVRLTV